ncbi:MAG: hypothetical protein IT451_08830, partial [Candidatus Brocadia sp.]|nr:hypothetical protein [Candidatus Brocadia sp.]
MNCFVKIYALMLVVAVASPAWKTAFAGVFYTLSRNADYSTNDRAFIPADALYVKVSQNAFDYREIKKSFFTLKSRTTKKKAKYPLHWDADLSSFTGLAPLENYPVGDKVTIKINLRGKMAKDEITKNDRFIIGNAGKWIVTGTISEKGDTGTALLADARVRV